VNQPHAFTAQIPDYLCDDGKLSPYSIVVAGRRTPICVGVDDAREYGVHANAAPLKVSSQAIDHRQSCSLRHDVSAGTGGPECRHCTSYLINMANSVIDVSRIVKMS
jgi:hypothetical protein